MHISDRPAPPEGPVIFENVHRDHMVISWKPPLDDGGSAVSNYIIEKRDINRDMWTTVTSATTKTTCKVPKLMEGRIYILRISAENMYGISDPLDSEEMKAKDLFSMTSVCFWKYNLDIVLFSLLMSILMFQIFRSTRGT